MGIFYLPVLCCLLPLLCAAHHKHLYTKESVKKEGIKRCEIDINIYCPKLSYIFRLFTYAILMYTIEVCKVIMNV